MMITDDINKDAGSCNLYIIFSLTTFHLHLQRLDLFDYLHVIECVRTLVEFL